MPARAPARARQRQGKARHRIPSILRLASCCPSPPPSPLPLAPVGQRAVQPRLLAALLLYCVPLDGLRRRICTMGEASLAMHYRASKSPECSTARTQDKAMGDSGTTDDAQEGNAESYLDQVCNGLSPPFGTDTTIPIQRPGASRVPGSSREETGHLRLYYCAALLKCSTRREFALIRSLR